MEQIKLSKDLIKALQNVLVSIDQRAADPYIMVQYLAATMGYLVGRQDIPLSRKQEICEELNAFNQHVMEDIDQTIQKQKQQQQASQEAFGIWKPGDN
jgi:hypothetical protein